MSLGEGRANRGFELDRDWLAKVPVPGESPMGVIFRGGVRIAAGGASEGERNQRPSALA